MREISCRKAAGLDEITSEVWKTGKFNKILLQLCIADYKEKTIEKWIKTFILPFSKTSGFEITKYYKGITLIAMAAKVYNSLLLNHMKHEVKKILRETKF